MHDTLARELAQSWHCNSWCLQTLLGPVWNPRQQGESMGTGPTPFLWSAQPIGSSSGLSPVLLIPFTWISPPPSSSSVQFVVDPKWILHFMLIKAQELILSFMSVFGSETNWYLGLIGSTNKYDYRSELRPDYMASLTLTTTAALRCWAIRRRWR